MSSSRQTAAGGRPVKRVSGYRQELFEIREALATVIKLITEHEEEH